MAAVTELRDHVLRLSREQKLSLNELHSRITEFSDGEPPVARAVFYSWFSGNGKGAEPKQSLVECIPAFASILGVPEHELWRVARVLPDGYDVGNSLASSAHAIRKVYRALQRTLSNSGLSTAGEALVVDRILHAKLDLQMTVWPVVRGYRAPLHLHSWIELVTVPAEQSRIRAATTRLTTLPDEEQRAYLRDTVITDSLWRALGLQWRDWVPPELERPGRRQLFLEVPVEERNRVRPDQPVHPGLQIDRALVLGPPWSHAELMAALLADALQFGSWDLRYVGLDRREDVVAFSRNRLEERRDRYVWALAQRADTMRELRSHAVAAAPGTLVVVMTYGDRLVRYVDERLRARTKQSAESNRLMPAFADELAACTDVVEVHLDDADLIGEDGQIDQHRVSDTVLTLTAEVLNQLHLHRGGPILPRWGVRFSTFRIGDEPRALDVLRDLASTVRWRPRAS